MKVLKTVWTFLRAHAAAATVVGNVFLTTALSGGVSYFVSVRLNEQQVLASARMAEVSEFVKTAQEFDTLTSAYMAKVAEAERVDLTSKQALLANIQRQYIQLKTVKAYLPEESKGMADKYQSTLVSLSGEIQSADDILSTGPVWDKLGVTLKSKGALISDLRLAANLPA